MVQHRPIPPNEDPVCGMTVSLDEARGKALVTEYQDREYGFCGKGCLLEFRDDPELYLAADYVPQM